MHATETTQLSNPAGLYVHFPWCVRKCPYCDFNSHPLNGTLDEDGYLAALRTDLRLNLPKDSRIDTVFFGGGTPSLFSPRAFAILLDDLGSMLAANAEITMEANPGTTEHQDFAEYRAAGINRLSLGAQSFADSQLRKLGRIHSAVDTRDSYARARAAGFDNINHDQMYGLPQQTAADAVADLRCALDLGPEHISWYQLTIEPRTEFAKRPPVLATESAIEDMETDGRERLAAAGYERYEVSAYSSPDRASRHNLNYWSFGDYIGLGAGAHGKLTLRNEIVRTRKPRQPRLYLQDPAATIRAPVEERELTFEFMLNALRLSAGVSFERFSDQTGLDRQALEPTWSHLVSQGLVQRHRIATTPLGFQYLDSVVQQFLL
jgi:oxygen-independent coproporphyrinogen-3 oxidase